MADVLIDTSAWIAALRGDDERVKRAVDGLLENDRAIMCGVVEMELIHGVRPRERKELVSLLSAVAFEEITREDYRSAGELLGDLRMKGTSIPSTDALIATICLRAGLSLLTLDKHFQRIPGLRRLNP